jgi:hypothetical protein
MWYAPEELRLVRVVHQDTAELTLLLQSKVGEMFQKSNVLWGTPAARNIASSYRSLASSMNDIKPR